MESVCRFTPTVGSNPTLSAIQSAHFALWMVLYSNRLRVDIHRGSNIRMSQEFLLHLEIDAQPVE